MENHRNLVFCEKRSACFCMLILVVVPLASAQSPILLNISDSTFPTACNVAQFQAVGVGGITGSETISQFAPASASTVNSPLTFTNGGQVIYMSSSVGAWAKNTGLGGTSAGGLLDLYLYNASAMVITMTVSNLNLTANTNYTLYLIGTVPSSGTNEDGLFTPVNTPGITFASNASGHGVLSVGFTTSATVGATNTLKFTWARYASSGDGVFSGLAIIPGSPANLAVAPFGIQSFSGLYSVSTGAGLVFQVNQSSADITSIIWNNAVQMQSSANASYINSGIGTPTTATVSASGNTILLTSSNATLTHYLIVRRNENTIYMATYNAAFFGELRWITRPYDSVFTNRPPWSDLTGTTYSVDGDAYGDTNGFIYSKFYGNQRAMDMTIRGETGPGVGMFMDYGNRESSSGGPFYRDIQDQTSELYNYMWSGHAQTEAIRAGVLNGPYALKFTDGSIQPGLSHTNSWSDYDPSTPFVQAQAPSVTTDYSWIESEGLAPLIQGWGSPASRGTVNGVAYGIPNGFQAVVGFANTNAQYWAIVGTNGTYVSPRMKPGTYLATLYKSELEVGTNSVTVVAGQTNVLNIASAEVVPTTIFRIGEWDGTPKGFMNADKITLMHPSDVRMGDWFAATNFVVGVDPISAFPMAQFRDLVTNPITIKFVLAANQIQTLRLRYGITVSYSGGRPAPNINSLWGATPYNPRYLDNRSLTHGTWRGFNDLYTYDVPASAFVVGTNMLTLGVISGQAGLGGYLSPSCAYDAVDLSVANSSQARPAAPSNLNQTVVGGSQMNLTWRNNSTNEMNFLVERTTDGTNYSLIAAVPVGVTNYTDSGLVNATNRAYRVRAFNSGGYSAYADQLLLTKLQAHLKFDESSGSNAADATGNGWNGTLVNSPGWVAGYSNNAVNLASASSQYVTLPTGAVSNLYDFSITAWVKQTTASSWARIFDFGTGTTAYMFLAPQNGSNNKLRFAITVSGGGGEQQIDGTTSLPAGVWKHVAVTLRGTMGILFVDGVPVGTNNNMTLSPALLGSTTQSYIGKSQYSDPYLNALVDDFRIYNGALTAGEVATLLTPLAVPSGIAATVGDAQVTLNWNSVANATSYQIFRSLTNGGPYTQVAVATMNNFTNTGLLNGTNYFLVVKAANTVGTSANSAQVSAQPVSSAPPTVIVQFAGTQLHLAWPATHLGWQLQVQTNSVLTGLGTNWFNVPSSVVTNSMSMPVGSINGSVFYRLRWQLP
jgi:rhamnogalacturonan endolyase